MKRFSFALAVCLVACASDPIGTGETTDSVEGEATVATSEVAARGDVCSCVGAPDRARTEAGAVAVVDVPTARLYMTAARDYLNLGLSEIAGDDPAYWDPGAAAEQATDGISLLQTSLTYLPAP